jgi:UPF0176 protein
MNTTKPITIATFYKFVPIAQPQRLQKEFKEAGDALGIKGTILLAEEGINCTLSGTDVAIKKMLMIITANPEIGGLRYQLSYADEMPFKRYFVKVKTEIVALGMPEVNPLNRVGTYVSPNEWNDLLADPQVTVIDVRNEYEVTLGKFKGAINPHTEVFKEFPQYIRQQLDPQKNRKVAMYCTGGVRCEKASALMLELGFEEIYHLKGGILNYLATVPAELSQWQGECFIFDDRLALDVELQIAQK